jgi:hypothetical protein
MSRLLLAGALVALSLGVMAVARLSLRAQASWLRWFPKFLAHRWTLASGALGAILLFFTGPFLLLGHPAVAAVGAVLAGLIIRVGARDVLAWLRDDLLEHRQTGRGWFEHSSTCAAHPCAHETRACQPSAEATSHTLRNA